ncbi:hypothetical protein [Streptomyces sp. Isolate_219]|uniref:hypothetical protein n=1 Tax=Streptomyces sp. Isolate_219 TaxID=2950110 RepID=UPI0021C69637|nr:hypothetical protein [Streptomyces sp. Isolate_219]MCR8574732.1 hypothetical protein [Streptomyces sp. Isolate_219]
MADDNEEFWAEERARAAAERGRQADPSACGTCRGRVEAGQQVEHDECAHRATLLQAPDHPGYELTTGMSEQDLAALPARFHVPVYMDTCTPKAWVCAVCWGDGWCTGWPCATAQAHGTEVFTPEHDAQQHQARQAAELARLAAELEKYVGKEPTRDEEAQHVNRCLDAVYDACAAARRDGRVLTVEEIEQAADGNRPGARKLLTETLAELADRARRVAESHQRFIEDHADPGTEALGAQYELAHALIATEGQGRPEPDAEPDIPWATARHVLWMFGEDGGMRPGSFTQQLIDTCARADVTHLARLGQAYPTEAHAVHLVKNTEDGITRLQAIAGGAA